MFNRRRVPFSGSWSITRSLTGLGPKVTGAGGSETGGRPMHCKVLLIWTWNCWPLRYEYWASEGWLGTAWAAATQRRRWSSLSATPQLREAEPKIARMRFWRSVLGSRGIVRVRAHCPNREG